MLLLNLFACSMVEVPKEKVYLKLDHMYYLSTLYSTVKVIQLTVILAECFIGFVLCEAL